MKKIILAILGISVILASCVGQKCRPSACETTYKCPEPEELPAPVKRHNRW